VPVVGRHPRPSPGPASRVGRSAGRSPFRAAVRAHVYLVALIIALAGIAGVAFWGLRIHERIGRTALEHSIAVGEPGSTIKCVARKSNGSVWDCAVAYSAESVCLIANVNPLGDWSTSDGRRECAAVPELAAFAPTPTSAGIAADLARKDAVAGVRCTKVPGTRVRWACLVGPSCERVRAVKWSHLTEETVPGLCGHKAIRRGLGA
jgi:hypothetical protein